MRSVPITEAKNRLSALLRAVRRGERIVITDRGNPVATLEPVHGSEGGRLADLVARGTVAPPALPPDASLLRRLPPAPRLAHGVSLVADLIEERGSGW